MTFLAQQHVALLQAAGWDAKIFCIYRSPKDQDIAFRAKRSKAQAFFSPHQYFEAADIIHRTKGWNVAPAFWDDLHAASHVVMKKFKVTLECGYDWGWDKAHIELKDWRTVRDRMDHRVPQSKDLDFRFAEVLPAVWKTHTKSKSYEARQVADPVETRARLAEMKNFEQE